MNHSLMCEACEKSRLAHTVSHTYEPKCSQSPSPEDLDPESRFLVVPDDSCM